MKRDDWEVKKLGEVATFVNGYAFKPTQWGESGIPIIRIQNLNNSDALYNYYDGEIPNKYVVEYGDILISWSASLGVYEWKGQKSYLNQHIFKVVFDKIDINKYFLKYAVSSKLNEMLKDAHGATMKHVVKKDFDNTKIIYPPLPEQSRIVEELDLLSNIIEKKRQQLSELDNLAQSIFYDMFGDPVTNEKGWEVKNIKDFANVKIGPFGSLLHNSDYISGGTPLVNPIHMKNESICAEEEFTVSDEKLKELSNYLLQTDDIIMARRGDIGRCAIVRKKDDGFVCGTGSLFIRLNDLCISLYLLKVIRTTTIIEYLVSKAKGATMLNINCKIVEDLPIPLPPLDLQQFFAKKIEAIEKQKAIIKQSIAETEELFNSRMDYYFN